MGIKNLNALIKARAPKAVLLLNFNQLSGWRISIDASLCIYQWCAAGVDRSIVNKQGKYINHIQGAFFRTLRLILADIHPVYVFDGTPPPMKEAVLTTRRKLRAAGAVRVSACVFAEVSKLLKLMGVQTINAEGEAEALASHLTIGASSLDAIATEDTDSLAFGAKCVIQGLNTTTKQVTVVDANAILSELALTRAQFIDLCILLGCDYTGTLPGIGSKRAFSLLKKWGSIEEIIAGESIPAPANFDYVGARALFNAQTARHVLETNKRLNREDLTALQEFLTIHGIEPLRVKHGIEKLATYYGVTL